MYMRCVIVDMSDSSVGVTVVVFFFFKQKTAYEMRISDWSSDGCSSDLEAQLDRFLLKVLIDYPSQADEARMVAAVSQGRTAADFDLSQVKQVLADGDIVSMQRGTAQVTLDNAVVQYAVRIAAATRKWPAIGSASGRARVCPYV